MEEIKVTLCVRERQFIRIVKTAVLYLSMIWRMVVGSDSEVVELFALPVERPFILSCTALP